MSKDILPTGIKPIDDMLRPRPGLPRGAITILAGPPGSGRSRLSMLIARTLAEAGRIVAFVDNEGMITAPEPFAVWRCRSMSELFSLLDKPIGPDLVIVDGIQLLSVPYDVSAAQVIAARLPSVPLASRALLFTWQTRRGAPEPIHEPSHPFDSAVKPDLILTLESDPEMYRIRVDRSLHKPAFTTCSFPR